MEPMYYIGPDVHDRKISYRVKDASGAIHSEGSISATRFTADYGDVPSLSRLPVDAGTASPFSLRSQATYSTTVFGSTHSRIAAAGTILAFFSAQPHSWAVEALLRRGERGIRRRAFLCGEME